MIMVAMPAMHEHVHERARRQEQPRQPGHDVRAVLGNQEECADDAKCKQHQPDPRAPGALVVPRLVRHG
jgi:hypothetical protein